MNDVKTIGTTGSWWPKAKRGMHGSRLRCLLQWYKWQLTDRVWM